VVVGFLTAKKNRTGSGLRTDYEVLARLAGPRELAALFAANKFAANKKGHRPHGVHTYQQLDLLILVERTGSKLFALRDRTSGASSGSGWHDGGGSITLEQHRHHRSFGFLNKGELALAEKIDADKIAEFTCPVATRLASG